MTPTTTPTDVIEFTVPLPPVVLRANGRGHYMKRNKAADAYSNQLYDLWLADPFECNQRWEHAEASYTWRYCGVAPDPGNIPGNVKTLQDILCVAPKTKPGKHRYYFGIVENDLYLTCWYGSEQVKTRAEECVIVTIVRRDG